MLKVEYKRHKIFEEKKSIFNDLFSGNYEVYIFGLTQYSKTISDFLNDKGIEISGFIDDFTINEAYYNNKIFKLNEIKNDSIVINGVIEGRPITVFNLLKWKGFKKIIDYFDFNYLNPEIFIIPFNSDNSHKILDNIKELETIYNKLEDENSKQIFNEVIDFRLNFNYYQKEFKYQPENQYFENFLKFENVMTFVDGGGFDGETTISAFKKFKNLSKVFYIEPFPLSMEISKKRLIDFKGEKIIFYETAISDKIEKKYITNDKGSANHLSNTGNLMVKVNTLDNLILEKIDYLKLDVEGSELSALLGAKNLITKNKPIIAVCVYHDQNHFWQIPNYLLNINLNYKVYLRHYTEGIYETVMYFL